MQKRKLLVLLKRNGWHLERHGSNHDIWTNDIDEEPIPRHRDVSERLAQSIIKKHNLK